MTGSRIACAGLWVLATALGGCWRSAGSPPEDGACASIADCDAGQTCSPAGFCECDPGRCSCCGADARCHDGEGDSVCFAPDGTCSMCPAGYFCAADGECLLDSTPCDEEDARCAEGALPRCDRDGTGAWLCEYVADDCWVYVWQPCDVECRDGEGCVDDPCAPIDECREGDVECPTDTSEARCEQGVDGCWYWGADSDCDGAQLCAGGVGCIDDICNSVCDQTGPQCDEALAAIVECGNYDDDDCLEWGVLVEDCAWRGGTCDAATDVCDYPCVDECVLGELQCDGDRIEICERSPLGCLLWKTETMCSELETCDDDGGEPACACADECEEGESRCEGNVWFECRENGAGCQSGLVETDCSTVAGEVCGPDGCVYCDPALSCDASTAASCHNVTEAGPTYHACLDLDGDGCFTMEDVLCNDWVLNDEIAAACREECENVGCTDTVACGAFGDLQCFDMVLQLCRYVAGGASSWCLSWETLADCSAPEVPDEYEDFCTIECH